MLDNGAVLWDGAWALEPYNHMCLGTTWTLSVFLWGARTSNIPMPELDVDDVRALPCSLHNDCVCKEGPDTVDTAVYKILENV